MGNQNTIIVHRNEITGTLGIAFTGMAQQPAITNAKLPYQPSVIRITTNRIYRQKDDSNTIENQNGTTEPKNKKTIPTTQETDKGMPQQTRIRHKRMQPATPAERHAVNQMLAQMRNSIHTDGYLHARGVKLSTYNLASYLQSIDTYFIDVDDLSATDTQQRFTPSWQIEIYKAISELKKAKAASKAGTNKHQEDVYALQQKLDQLIARHQDSFDQKGDYKSQMRTIRRQAKKQIRETSTEQLSTADLYELETSANDTTANVYELEEVKVDTVEDTHDVSIEAVQLAWAQAQDDAQKRRFADCVSALYGSQKHK